MLGAFHASHHLFDVMARTNEKNEKSDYEPGSEFTSGATSKMRQSPLRGTCRKLQPGNPLLLDNLTTKSKFTANLTILQN